MTNGLQHFDLSDPATDIIAAIDADGGAIVENFLSADLRSRLREQLLPHVTCASAGFDGDGVKQAFWGEQTKRFSGLAAKAPAFAEVIDHDLLHTWAEHGFGNDYWLNTGQAMVVGPGSPAQFLHRDAGNWPVMVGLGKDGPEATLSAMVAIEEFTADNGATRVVPGSHRWDDFDREAQESEVVQAVMPAGSAMLYAGKTIHGAGANVTSDRWRFAVHISFALAQLTPEEAHPLSVPWHAAKDFPERVQHMLGYQSHRTFLPDWAVLWTVDYRDARESLEPESAGVYRSAGAKLLPPITPPTD